MTTPAVPTLTKAPKAKRVVEYQPLGARRFTKFKALQAHYGTRKALANVLGIGEGTIYRINKDGADYTCWPSTRSKIDAAYTMLPLKEEGPVLGERTSMTTFSTSCPTCGQAVDAQIVRKT